MDDREREAILQRILDHAERPRGRGRIEDAVIAQPGGVPGCADVQVWMLDVDAADRIVRAAWEGQGCNLSVAGASLLSERLVGRTLREVLEMPHDMLVGLLGSQFALTRPRCSSLALNTVKTGILRHLQETGRGEEAARAGSG